MSEPGFLHHCFQMFPCLPCKRKPNPEVSKLKQAQQQHSQMFSIPKMLNQRHKHCFLKNQIIFKLSCCGVDKCSPVRCLVKKNHRYLRLL